MDTEPNTVICLNCSNVYAGNYCNICGQRATIHRLNLKHVIYDFFHALTHMDKGFLFSAKEMTVRPGHSVREYIQGKRSNHANPFLMLVIIGGICSLIYYKIDIKMLNSFTISQLSTELHILSSKFFALSMIIYCIVFSLIDYLIFRFKKYNYTELFVMNTFIAVEILFLNIILVPVYMLTNSSGLDTYVRFVILLLILAYLIFTRYQFFEVSRKKGLKGLFAEAIIFLIVLLGIGWNNVIALF